MSKMCKFPPGANGSKGNGKSKGFQNGKGSLKVNPIPIVFNKNNGSNCQSKKPKPGSTNDTTERCSVTQLNRNLKFKNIQEQRKQLPIFFNKDNLIELIKKHKSLVILGEPGSGKTTQLPQYIDSANLHQGGKIAITQPRRVAAISVAMRVAQEYGNEMSIGEHVGYSVRFEDVTSSKTKIKFLTDGMLLREALGDRLLLNYSVVILDEAHERTIHTDVLFGIVKQAQKDREDRKLAPLKIIITSATMDVDHFANYFDCQVVYLEGRTYPINVHYLKSPQDDYQAACVAAFFQIHKDAPSYHDVLIFMTGQEEIEKCAHQIRILAKDPDVEGPPVKVCTLYASQPGMQQMTVFAPAPNGTRKVVISTNIAETSITITGIKYVIDSGMIKARTFCASTGLEVLKVQRVSQEQAIQRTGRAGRESEGFCYRLYTKSQFEQMRNTSVPEIQRANLNSVALQLLAMGIHMSNFDFLDPPPKDAVEAAFAQLKLLGAIDDVKSVTLTDLGEKMAKFPLEPRFSKVLITAEQFGCLKEAITVVSLLSSDSILLNPPSKREETEQAREKYRSPYGDHITLLNIYRAFENIGKGQEKSWCQDHFINMKNILYVKEVRAQLEEICTNNGQKNSSCGKQLDQLRKCLLAGLFMNFAEIHEEPQMRRERHYLTLDKRQTALIHPSSVLYGIQPAYLIFTEVVHTTKCYLRDITIVEGPRPPVGIPDTTGYLNPFLHKANLHPKPVYMFLFDDSNLQPSGDHLRINTKLNSLSYRICTCAILIHCNRKMFRLIAISYILAIAMAAAPSGDPRQAQIIRSESDISPEGSYQFAYETDNGISAQEQGNIQPQGPEQAIKSVSGQFQFLTPENEQIQISYVADENGYQPTGNALPTPPPIPIAIQRALEYIAAHPQQPDQPQKRF